MSKDEVIEYLKSNGLKMHSDFTISVNMVEKPEGNVTLFSYGAEDLFIAIVIRPNTIGVALGYDDTTPTMVDGETFKDGGIQTQRIIWNGLVDKYGNVKKLINKL